MQIDIPGYSIVNSLSESDSASVFLALDTNSGHELALKVVSVSPQRMATVTILEQEQLGREIDYLTGLQHPNITSILQVGFGENYYCLALPFLSGRSLSHKRFEMDLLARLQVVIDLAHALEYLAQREQAQEEQAQKTLVQLALTPDNILIHESDGRAILFGLRLPSLASNVHYQLTEMHFFSLAQLRGEVVDGQSHLYSLGVILFLLLTDYLPYPNCNFVDLSVSTFRAVAPRLPCHLSVFQPIVNRLLAVAPSQPYQSATECLSDLNSLPESDVLIALKGSVKVATKAPSAVSLSAAPKPAVRSQVVFNAPVHRQSILATISETTDTEWSTEADLFRPLAIAAPKTESVGEQDVRTRYHDFLPMLLLGIILLSLTAAVFYAATKFNLPHSKNAAGQIRLDLVTPYTAAPKIIMVKAPDLIEQADILRQQLPANFSLATDLVIIYRAALRGTDEREKVYAHAGIAELQQVFSVRITDFLAAGNKTSALQERDLALTLFDAEELLPVLTDTFGLLE